MEETTSILERLLLVNNTKKKAFADANDYCHHRPSGMIHSISEDVGFATSESVI